MYSLYVRFGVVDRLAKVFTNRALNSPVLRIKFEIWDGDRRTANLIKQLLCLKLRRIRADTFNGYFEFHLNFRAFFISLLSLYCRCKSGDWRKNGGCLISLYSKEKRGRKGCKSGIFPQRIFFFSKLNFYVSRTQYVTAQKWIHNWLSNHSWHMCGRGGFH